MTRTELTNIQGDIRSAAEDAAHERFMSRRANFIESNPNAVSPSERKNFMDWKENNAPRIAEQRERAKVLGERPAAEIAAEQREAARAASALQSQPQPQPQPQPESQLKPKNIAAEPTPRQGAVAGQQNADPLNAQYEQALATAQAALRRRMTDGDNALKRMTEDILGNRQTVASIQSAPNMAIQQTAPGLAILKRQLANRATASAKPAAPQQYAAPTYAYGGVTVTLPKGLDLGNSAAVYAAMDENNELIDMMNGLYEEV